MNRAASRKRGLAGAGDDLGRDPGQGAEQGFLLAQGQRHQCRPRLDDLEAELARQIVGEAGRPHLRDGRTAGGDHQRRRGGGPAAPGHAKPAVGMGDVGDALAERDADRAPRALVHQHVDDLARRAVAEQLAERLFVPGDAMAVDQVDEILRRVAAQRRHGEMAVGRKVALRHGLEIGEVAAAAARDQDLLSGPVGMIDQQHPAAALPRHRRAHQPGAAGAEDDDIWFRLRDRTALLRPA